MALNAFADLSVEEFKERYHLADNARKFAEAIEKVTKEEQS